MSFEDEWLDLNNIYQNMKAENEELRVRVVALEQLMNDGLSLLSKGVDDIVECHFEMAEDEFTDTWIVERDAWQQRAKTLLGEEQQP